MLSCSVKEPEAIRYSSAEFDKYITSTNEVRTARHPHYAESNGLAERGVRRLENLWEKERDNSALLTYRGTPLKNAAELFFDKSIRT